MSSFLGRLRRRPSVPVFNAEQRAAHEIIRSNTMLNVARLSSLWDQVVACERLGVDGALVECGVWKGGAVAWMALASRSTAAPPRQLHLFDAFDDICEPDPAVDGEIALRRVAELGGPPDPQGRLQPMPGIYDAKGGHGTVEACREVLERAGHPNEFSHFHVGWFQETLPTADTGPIAVLRLDGDWYASTIVCLDYLYDRVTPGGFVVIDDYLTFEGCRLAVDEFRSKRGIRQRLTAIDVNAVWWRR